MRWRVYLTGLLVWVFTIPSLPALAQQNPAPDSEYVNIIFKMHDATQLEAKSDFRGALDDFKDCYTRLAKIHDNAPDWEPALVVKRMDDCRSKIAELQLKIPAQDETPPPSPTVIPQANTLSETEIPDNLPELKKKFQDLEATVDDLRSRLTDSEAMVETYRARVTTLNAMIKGLQSKSDDASMEKLLDENKELTDKLNSAQKELTDLKTNPTSELAETEKKLANMQQEFDASNEANKTLQLTITNLKQQLDQSQSDLADATRRLADGGMGNADYAQIKHENEIMRGYLTRELKQQAYRDEARRLYLEEYANLKIKSKILEDQFDIAVEGPPAPISDEEKMLLLSLRTPGSEVAPIPDAGAGNTVAAIQTPNQGSNPITSPSTPIDTGTQTPATQTPNTPTPPNPADGTNTPTPPSVPPDTNTSQTPVTPSDTAPVTPTPPVDPASTNQTPTPPPAPPATNSPDPSISSTPGTTNDGTTTGGTPSTPTPGTTDPASPPASNNGQTTSNDPASPPPTPPASNDPNTDPNQLASHPRLPLDMRQVAQEAADLFKNQHYDEAAAKYQVIIEKYPDCLYAWSNLGVVRFQQGDLNDALKALLQAVKLSPTDSFSYSNLGIVYYELNQYDNAIEALNQAKALDGNDARTRNYLGCAYSRKGWDEVSEKEFRKAIEIDPKFGDAHFNLSLVYATEKPPMLEMARQEYKKALDLGIAKDDRLEKLLQLPSDSSSQTTASQNTTTADSTPPISSTP